MLQFLCKYPVLDWRRHKFCYLDWHADTGSADIQFVDAPTPSEHFHRYLFRKFEEVEVREFVSKLQNKGWQLYIKAFNREGCTWFFIHAPALESAYEYCILSASIFVQPKDEMVKPHREGLYRLGGHNESLIAAGNWRQSYAETLQYLQDEHWEFVNTEVYPFYGPRSNRRLQLHYYRRLLPKT